MDNAPEAIAQLETELTKEFKATPFCSTLWLLVRTMPRRHRYNRRGLRKAARVLEVGTTLAVAASTSMASAFMVGAKNSISMPSHFGAKGRGVTDLCGSCLLPVVSVLKGQGSSHGRSHVDDESADARALAHALLHPGRKSRSGPLHATSILLHDEPVRGMNSTSL